MSKRISSLSRPLATVSVLAAVGLSGGTRAETTLEIPTLLDWNLVNTQTVDAESQEGRTYIYPDAITRDQDALADGTGSPAYIFWELDDASGRAPGIQVVSNDLTFNLLNCIMASGERPDTGPKTCGDPQSSAKRFKMTVTEPSAPVDLVFDVGTGPMTYDDALDAAVAAGEVEIGRVYRVLQKWGNDTGQRVRNFRLELGYGTGADFVPANFAADDLAFELRPLIPRSFFGQGGEGSDREVWNPDSFATFSPSMFDIVENPRFGDGFFDDQSAGLIPPQDTEDGDKTQYIDSGTENTAGLDGAIIEGATTPNYFALFGYLMTESMLPVGIYEDDDGDAGTEGDLVAWWDGSDWRYGVAQDFSIVPVEQLIAWAQRPLSETEVLEPPRYETGVIDDLGGLNVDTFIYVGDGFDPVAHPSITLRMTVEPVTSNTIDGSEDPLWTLPGNEAPELSSYLQADLAVSATASVTSVRVGNTLTLELSVTNAGPNQATGVEVTATSLGDYFAVTPPAGCALSGAALTCTVAALPSGASETFAVALRAETSGTATVDVSASAVEEDPVLADNTDSVSLTVSRNSSGGGGCAYQPGGPIDPTLPLLLAAGIAGLAYRRRKAVSGAAV